MINYKIDDIVTSDGITPLGVCTNIDNGLVYINHKCYGGAKYFMKYDGIVESGQFKKEIEEGLRYNEWAKTHNIHEDKVEISIAALIEIKRAFEALGKDKSSYLHRVFSDDYVFMAMKEIEETYSSYFQNS